MSKVCSVCGKGPMVSLSVKRAGSRLRSGKRRYVKSKTKRRQIPNLQRVKLNINGTVKRVRVCVSCLSSSKAQKVV
jgi:large subunit ribosomal protein L28